MKKVLFSAMIIAAQAGFAFNAQAAAEKPDTVNIGFQKANIFALLKYRGTLDQEFKKQGIAVHWIEFPAGPQMLEGLNIGSIDLAATDICPGRTGRSGLSGTLAS